VFGCKLGAEERTMLFDTLDNLELYQPLLPLLQTVIEVMDKGDVYTMKDGSYATDNPNVRYSIGSYMTSSEGKRYEIHKKATDVQIMLEGEELMSVTWREAVKDATPYDEAKDIHFCDGDPLLVMHAAVGRFCVFFPGEPHKPGVPVVNPMACRKVVFKLLG